MSAALSQAAPRSARDDPHARGVRGGRVDSERLTAIRDLVGRIPDPEIPVVTLAELGILRDVADEDGVPVVSITPTYSGCPATEAIADSVRQLLDEAGFVDARVRVVLAPAWTSDWIGDEARRKLRDYGIAPPACMAGNERERPLGNAQPGAEPLRGTVATLHWHPPRPRGASQQPTPTCPRCGSDTVEAISHWGSTPCKALYRCLACREPFDYFKPY